MYFSYILGLSDVFFTKKNGPTSSKTYFSAEAAPVKIEFLNYLSGQSCHPNWTGWSSVNTKKTKWINTRAEYRQ